MWPETVLMTLARVYHIGTWSGDKQNDSFILELFLLVSVWWTLCRCTLAKRQGAEYRYRELWLWDGQVKAQGSVKKSYSTWADCIIASCDSVFPGASDLFQLHVLNLVFGALIKSRVWRHCLGVISAMGLVLKVLEPSVLKDKMSPSSSITFIILESSFNTYLTFLEEML